jgi:hypothetical protein
MLCEQRKTAVDHCLCECGQAVKKLGWALCEACLAARREQEEAEWLAGLALVDPGEGPVYCHNTDTYSTDIEFLLEDVLDMNPELTAEQLIVLPCAEWRELTPDLASFVSEVWSEQSGVEEPDVGFLAEAQAEAERRAPIVWKPRKGQRIRPDVVRDAIVRFAETESNR